jgi:hypothetical protein
MTDDEPVESQAEIDRLPLDEIDKIAAKNLSDVKFLRLPHVDGKVLQ